MSKQPPPAPTASTIGPCPTVFQVSRTPRHWKFTQHLRTTRPPPVPFGVQDGDSSASIMTSKDENLLCCLIGSFDPLGCLSVLGFSFPRFLGSGDLTQVLFCGFARWSRIFCLSFLSAFAAFCFSFTESVSDMSRSELADASVDAVL